MTDTIFNQSVYHNKTTVSIDIDKIYQDFIETIDSIRSFVSISDQSNNNIINSLNENTYTKLRRSLKIETSPQESRAHAFFRLIGLPIVSKDFEFYNPGYDNIYNINKKIKNTDKLKIIKNPIDNFNKLSIERERYFNSLQNIFLDNYNINASALALSSINKRKFIDHIDPQKTSDVFDMNLKNQQYQIESTFKVGDFSIDLSEIIDSNAISPNIFPKLNTRQHIIKPLIVDGRIDFSVFPSQNKVAVPFVYDNSNLKINETSFVQRPIIEKIILDKIGMTDQSLNASIDSSINLGLFFENIKNYINEINKKVVEDSLLDSFKNDQNDDTRESIYFSKYRDIIYSMINKLIESEQIIEQVQSTYYWLPVPAIRGTEFGCLERSVLILKKDHPLKYKVTTKEDNEIIKMYLYSLSDEFSKSGSKSEDSTGYYPNSILNLFSSESSDSITKNSAKRFEELSKKRKSLMKQASESLRTIEIILGEFSGLGLCDIVCIMASLYLLPLNDLLGLLDEDAYDRFIKRTNASSIARSNFVDSYTNLLNLVISIYQFMDATYSKFKLSNNLI